MAKFATANAFGKGQKFIKNMVKNQRKIEKRRMNRAFIQVLNICEKLVTIFIMIYHFQTRQSDKPSDGLAFVRNNFVSNELTTLKAQLENLTQENQQLKSKVTQIKKDLNKREGIIGILHSQIENLTTENDLLKADISENEENLMSQVQILTQENEQLKSKRQRYRRRISVLLEDLDGYETLIRASEYFLDAVYNDDDDVEDHFEAFASLFRRVGH